ncbi:MAG: hypothetical protein FJX64_05600 [Alphaproteobacteria bacterium]|nr:hypothetical protein [Alphaproteobacteria bacterium]MBM4438634.1 hypothetical protein [Actinomycetota bacterium]
MIGKLLRYAILFLLPFAVYAGWLAVARRRLRGHENEPGWRDAPLVWLTAAGLGLVLLGFIVAAIFDGFDADCTYIPSRMVDGQLVPAELRCDDA